MKKHSIIFMLLLALFLSSCESNNPAQIEESSAKESTSSYISLPKPEEIILMDDPAARLDFDEEPKYRVVYYGMSGAIGGLIGNCNYQFLESEMELATYIKHNKTPKEELLAAIQEEYDWCTNNGFYITEEENELPNADIIYTFDNEVINAYYRRENPVAPDWSKVKTYGSYEEYKAANP